MKIGIINILDIYKSLTIVLFKNVNNNKFYLLVI